MNINSFKNHLIENNLLTPREYADLVDKYCMEQHLSVNITQMADAGMVKLNDDLIVQWGVAYLNAGAGISGVLLVPLKEGNRFVVIADAMCTTMALMQDGSKYSIVTTKNRPVQWYCVGAPSEQNAPAYFGSM